MPLSKNSSNENDHEILNASQTDAPDVQESSSTFDVDDLPVTTEDLIPLIKAIIFKYPEYHNKPEKIHEEIVSVASRMEPILSTISLEAVETACMTMGRLQLEEAGSQELHQPEVLKLFTVGNNVSIISQEKKKSDTAELAALAASLSKPMPSTPIVQWVNVQLDVPADKSGLKPHQAFINFNTNNGVRNQESVHSSSEKTKTAEEPISEAQGVFIVKIQVAMGGVEQKAPMLLYNYDRTIKTFIHFDEENPDFFNILQYNIVNKGVEGALGKSGGLKGYFYAKIEEASRVGAKYLSVNCTNMAPDQTW